MASTQIPVQTRSGTLGPVVMSVDPSMHRIDIVTNSESLWDPGDSVDVLFEVSRDSQATWHHLASANGLAPSVDFPHLELSVTIGNLNDGANESGVPDPYPTHARVTVTHHGSVRYGATWSIT